MRYEQMSASPKGKLTMVGNQQYDCIRIMLNEIFVTVLCNALRVFSYVGELRGGGVFQDLY